MIVVDGGHTFDVALADIGNFARVASRPRNVIMVDDIQVEGVGKAWKAGLKSGIVQQVSLCADVDRRKYAVGVVTGEK